MRTLIIAEAGVNHDGVLADAHALVDAAADAGADVVKFQTFRADRLVTASASRAAYQVRTTGSDAPQHAMLRALELAPEAHVALAAHAQARGIVFASTAFDGESLDFLATLRPPFVKVPSGELTNLPYLRHVAAMGSPVLLSTGMATLGEIEAALDALAAAGCDRTRVTVLHCTTEYPAPMPSVNLRALATLRTAFGTAVGYSDHTDGLEVPVAAVALGATVIEKHLTLDRSRPGPDHAASLEPLAFAAMVAAIRNVEIALGDGIKRPGDGERANARIARRSIVAACAIRAGERFSADNLTAKRPGTGLSPMRWDDVLGRVATRDYAPDEAIVA
ncbi:MAG: N-acetylneuraminate synthase [Gemmatimonadaceae bacterium]|jgi:N,N'-diacetyllegionaminate synthase|nr:N-acetylneuraminate synthase [Gemmatimonadaceae bacterium]